MTGMPKRTLGRTGIEVGVIGLGTEYLLERTAAIETIREALDHGVNFFDVLMPQPEYRDNMGAAFRDRRDEAILTCHLGGVLERGQWSATRDPAVAEPYVEDWLRRLDTDYVDILNITCVDKVKEYETIMGPGGMMELAERLVRQGKARYISLSGHESDIALLAAESGRYDALIQGCNIKWPVAKVGDACSRLGVGLVAMKPYSGGELFHPPYSGFVTPVRALSYVLAQPGVVTVIPGARNVEQLRDALRYVTASDEERDFTRITGDNLSERLRGTCTSCNHCLPCSAGIPIGDVMAAYRGLGWGLSYAPDMARNLADQPARCTACGECMTRCPFAVDVPAEMLKAAAAFAPYRAPTEG